MRQSYHLGVRTYRDREELVVLYVGLEDDSPRRAARGRGRDTTDGKIAPRSIARARARAHIWREITANSR